MGVSTDAILAYGYDLGGDEAGWKVREVSEYGELHLDWYDPEDDEDGFDEAAKARMLAAVGFTEEYPHDQPQEIRRAYFDRKGEAEARLGVKIETYAHGEYPSYLLAAKVITVYRGDCKVIDPAELQRLPVAEGWDGRLAAAIASLGLTPTQERARWLLVSYADGF